MTAIQGSSLRLTRLGPDGQPTGEPTEIVKAFTTAEFIPKEPEPEELQGYFATGNLRRYTLELKVLDVNPVALYLITGYRRFLGRPRPLRIDGREYRRRVRRR